MKLKLIIFTTLILGLFACVDIIDLPINSSTPRPVIEAYIDAGEFATVSVTMSAAYDDVLDTTQLNAIITLSNSLGMSEILAFNDSLNLYQGSKIKGQLNSSYSLEIKTDTSIFEVKSEILSSVSIDSISCEYNEAISELMQKGKQEESDEPSYDSLYNIMVYFTDAVAESNYYLLRFAQNGVIELGYMLGNDKDGDGESQRPMFMQGLALTDTVTINLYSLDKGGYTYYEGLSDLGDSDIPYNPYTNIVGTTDVLGFFSARFIIEQSFVVGDIATFPEPIDVPAHL